MHTQEDFSDEEDGQDEDLSAALATLRMQQESRTKGGEAGRPGQGAGRKDGSVGGASGGGPQETAILTQVVKHIGVGWLLFMKRPPHSVLILA